MSVSIRVSSLITPVHCITQTEEPKELVQNAEMEEIDAKEREKRAELNF